MNTLELFSQLRKLAEDRRDKAIEAARVQFAQSIRDIAAIEHDLSPPAKVERPPTTRKYPLVDLITDNLPTDRVFTIDDIHGIVNQVAPDRKAGHAVVRTNIHRLLKLGVVKRITTAEGKNRATFAVDRLPVERVRTMQEWAEIVLAKAGQSLSPEQLLVGMLDAGYKSDANPKNSINAIRRYLRLKNLPKDQ